MTGLPPDKHRDDDVPFKPTRVVIPVRIVPAVPKDDRELTRERRRVHEQMPTPVYPDPVVERDVD